MSELAKHTPVPPAIRLATDADVLPMAKVHIVSWRETYPGLLPEPMLARLSVADEAIRWQRMLDRPRAWGGAVSFVAEQHGSIVGYGSCGEQRTSLLRGHGFGCEIYELYVLRCAQGQGAGSGLMRAMASTLLDRGHRAVSLWVLEQNGAARRFYEHLGGRRLAEKRSALAEVAYGWADLQTLVASRS